MKLILGFVGHGASGKGAASDYVIKKYNAGYFRFSKMLYDLVTRLYLPADRNNLIRMSEIVRHEFGEDTLARVMKEDVLHDEHEIICVDGIRRLADIVELRTLPGFKIIYIDTDIKTRYDRLIQRNEKPDDRTKTYEQFLADEQRPTELSIDEVAREADYVITNNGTLEELYAQIDTIVQQ